MAGLAERIEAALGARPARLTPLSGGCVGEVYSATIPDGSRIVVKSTGPGGKLDVEGWMLRYLAEHSALPVPRVLHAGPSLLVMEFVEGESRFDESAEWHAAELLAGLHSVSAARF